MQYQQEQEELALARLQRELDPAMDPEAELAVEVLAPDEAIEQVATTVGVPSPDDAQSVAPVEESAPASALELTGLPEASFQFAAWKLAGRREPILDGPVELDVALLPVTRATGRPRELSPAPSIHPLVPYAGELVAMRPVTPAWEAFADTLDQVRHDRSLKVAAPKLPPRRAIRSLTLEALSQTALPVIEPVVCGFGPGGPSWDSRN